MITLGSFPKIIYAWILESILLMLIYQLITL